ncbi:MAG: PKD domain-containing protein [Bacteroidia bacterium]
MKLFNYCILFLLILASMSCRKKEYPESTTEGAPIFSCSMNINGAPTSFEAGINNYYMYSSFQQDSNNVYGFTADIKQSNCTNCPSSIQIQINDFKVMPSNAPAQIDSSLLPGNYNYLLSTAASFYTAQFQSSYNKTAASYLWNFGDGTTSNLQTPSHIYKKSGKYKVDLTVNGTSSCVNNISSFHNIGFLTNGFRTSIITDSIMGNSMQFSALNAQGSGTYSYSWNFGDGTALSSSANPMHYYQYAGSYPVSLRVIDGNSDTAYAKYNVVTQSDLSSCATNYTISNVSLTPNTLGLSNIIVNWIDANGTLYSSKNPLQPANSYFTIVSVENYKDNDSNQMTKKVHVKFKCTVYNGPSSILIDNADAIISVAYK